VKPSWLYFAAGVISAIAGVIMMYFSVTSLKVTLSCIAACAGVLMVAISAVMGNTEKILEKLEEKS
jgi:uncharacterized membrane protein HdeD (DUF308 family)